MPMKFKPLPDDEPQISLPQFLHRLKTEPAFVEKMRAHYEQALALPLTPDTEELHTKARAALKTLKHHQGAFHAMRNLEEGLEILDMSADDFSAAASSRLHALTEEASDHLLDVMEPERTKLMNAITSIRAGVQSLTGE